ncbi:uncharacterized protein LOC134185080 [Corticium candelabrum]|nr:uncharacterized protein LOC134185080 [Corticium candelabrum]
MLLLRHCHVPRMTHLTRSVAPQYLSSATSLHDHQTRQTFVEILKYGPIQEDRWLQATLPIRHGGFGMTSIKEICQLAFVSSWAHTLSALPKRFPNMEKILDDLVFHPDTTGSIGCDLQRATPPDKSLIDLLDNPNRLQQKLTRQYTTSVATYVVEHAPLPRDLARLRSLRGNGAGAWLTAIPESTNLAFEPYEYRLACLLRMGLQLPAVSWIQECNCGSVLDDMGYHLLTCKKGGGPVWSHDSVVSNWDDCLRQLKIHHKREPRDRYSNSNNRPDIVVFDVGTGANTELDVALSHPWASDILCQAALRDGAAATRREDRKFSKYSQIKLPGMASMKFVPLVMEHFGRWGDEATKYLQELSQRSTDDAGNHNSKAFMCYWRKRFSTTLQKCNAKTICKKILTLTSNDNRNIDIDDFLTQFFIH